MIRYVLVASVGAAIAVFFFSEKQPVYYDCLTDAGETFQLKHTPYRFWVSLWSEADGSLVAAHPNGFLRFYAVRSWGSDEEMILGDAAGGFSRLSLRFSVKEPDGVSLSGRCQTRS
jgi:hypothetical protein